MIVDPIRHITDILALGGIFVFAYLFALMVRRISASMAHTDRMAAMNAAGEAAPEPIQVLANDNAPADRAAERRAA